MSILLIGAQGQLGSELQAELRDLGPLVATCRSGGATDAIVRSGVDLTVPESIRAVIREVQPRIIVNAAAYTAVDAAESDPTTAYAINETAPGMLADEAARLGALLVHFSTDYVFNGDSTRPWNEEDRIDPVNEYGRSKAAGEAAVRASGAAHLIIRTSWLYGRTGRNFVKTMLQSAARQSEIRVVDDQVGSPTSAHFVARATRHILAQASADAAWFEQFGGTLHVACAGEASWHDFATEIIFEAAELGLLQTRPRVRPVSSSEFAAPARRPRYSRLDTSRLVQRFGLIPPAWDEELRNRLASVYAGQAG
jgi:dTDP-4-dehydrorhamnose reductase